MQVRWGINGLPYDYESEFKFVKHQTHLWVPT